MEPNNQTELLREIRDLLRLIAEPAIAKRDERLRAGLLEIVGKSQLRAKAVLLMDGSKTQAAICKVAGIDAGQLSRLAKSLRAKSLIEADEKQPKILIDIPTDFFNGVVPTNGRFDE